jgi:hypothetical protein
LEAWRRNWRRWIRREEPGHPLAAATSIASPSSTVPMVARRRRRKAPRRRRRGKPLQQSHDDGKRVKYRRGWPI